MKIYLHVKFSLKKIVLGEIKSQMSEMEQIANYTKIANRIRDRIWLSVTNSISSL